MKELMSVILGMLIISGLVAQNPGDLDMEFGENGVSTQYLPGKAQIYTLSVLDDGKIIGAGNQTTATDDRLLLSYLFNTDGTLAPFAGGDWLGFQLGYNYEITNSSYVLPDGRILLGGIYYDSFPDTYFFVLCLYPDGTLDTSFGEDGLVIQPGLMFRLNGISVYYGLSGEFDIFLCGYSTEPGYNPTILKLDQNGQMVNTFGTDGIFSLSEINGSFSDIYAYSFSGSGYLLLGGYYSDVTHVFISKHDPWTGELVTSFGTEGITELAPAAGEEPDLSSIVFHSTLSENTITAFGDYIHPEGDVDVFAVRLNASDGTLDPNFGVNGWSSLRAAGSNENLFSAILQTTDGKYYFGGRSNVNDIADFMIGRISNNGFLDPAFGDNGITLTHIDNSDYLWSLALSPNEDRLYGGGNSMTSTTEHPSVACYYTGVGVGISNANSYQQKINIYPNPASNHITLKTELYDNYLIEIFSPDGRLIMQESQENNSFQINIDHLKKGMYFLKISGSNISQTRKIIKH